MAGKMTHWERVRAALKGERPDRPPVSVWRHFYHQENSAQGLADAMLSFQHSYDWDFMKVNPRASYHAEDWGLTMRFSDSDAREPQMVDWPVKKLEDWDAIQPLDIHKGALGQQLEALRLIARGLDGQLPFLMTVFTPLSIAGRLCGSDDAMTRFLREHPSRAHQALEAVTETFARFGKECLDIGASGLFYATTSWATYDRLTDDEYAEFGRRYDLKVLEAVPQAEFHVLHVCRSRNMLSALKDYPVAAFNWDARDETNPSLRDGANTVGKAVIGGIPHRGLIQSGSPDEVASDVRHIIESMTGVTRWMLGSGCTVPATIPEANLWAVRDAVGE